MKFSNLRAFEKHLEAAAPQHFSSLYLILSQEAFERKQACEKLLIALKGSHKELYQKTFDAQLHSIDVIMEEVYGYGMFAPKQTILVHNCDQLNKNATSLLEKYFLKEKSVCYLILTAPNLNRATNFYKKGEKAGVILDIPEVKPWEKEKLLQDWICAELALRGKSIQAKAVHALLKQAGVDQSLLSQEMDKLCCYVGERAEITLHDVGQICIALNLENGWQLGEALFLRDTAAALRIGKGLLAESVALIALLRQIRSQFQTEFQVCSFIASGNTHKITEQFPYMKGQILERHIKMAKNYGIENFKKGLVLIDEAEWNAKNGHSNPDLLIELLIMKLTI